MEDAGAVAEGGTDVEGGLVVDRVAFVGLIDRRGAGVLEGHADGVDDIGSLIGLGGGDGGGGVLAVHLDRLTGKVDVHLFGCEEPDVEFYVGGVIRGATVARFTEEVDAVGGGDGIEKLFVECLCAGCGEGGVDHLGGEGLFPQGEIFGAAVLDIEVQLGCGGDADVDVADIGEVRQREPRERGGDQHQHRDDAQQEGGAALDACLRALEFIQFL